MAIVDNAFREWIADFKATNPGVADSRAILDTAQYAFAAGRKAQRDIDAARQPVGEPVGYLYDWTHSSALGRGDEEFTSFTTDIELARGSKGGVNIRPVYAAPPAQAVDLAPDHRGMRVSCSGLLSQVQGGLKSNPELAEMVRQLHGHLNELGKRWYAGDRKVVDEFLQLYVIEDGARRALIDSQAVGNG